MTDKLLDEYEFDTKDYIETGGVQLVKVAEYEKLKAELLAKDAEIQRIKNIGIEDMAIEMTNRVKGVNYEDRLVLAKAIHDLINGETA